MTTAISRDDVRHLAQLSHLQLSADEVESLRSDLENILEYIALLGELDTSGVEPTYQVTDLENIMRDDTVKPHLADRDKLLSLAVRNENNQIKVPKVL